MPDHLTFGDIEGKLDVRVVECTRCDRKGRYTSAADRAARPRRHSAGSLYQSFPPCEARRVLRRLEFHYVGAQRAIITVQRY